MNRSLNGGVGLRPTHYPYLEKTPKLKHTRWFEAVSENCMTSFGRPLAMLELIRRDYPVALHGVSLSIGSSNPISQEYKKTIKDFYDRIDPFLVSDHLCWTGHSAHNVHDLLPMLLNRETLNQVADKICEYQSFLGRRLFLENVSGYYMFYDSEFNEAEFLVELSKKSGCGILLDINNVYVNCKNFNLDPLSYINEIPTEMVGQVHLAGFSDMGDYLFDTHSAPVFSEVWLLFEAYIQRHPDVPTLVEWDDAIPDFLEVEKEVAKANAIWQKYFGKSHETRRTL